MLGLQELLGKAVLKLIAKEALHQTFDWLSQYPQLPTYHSGVAEKLYFEGQVIFVTSGISCKVKNDPSMPQPVLSRDFIARVV